MRTVADTNIMLPRRKTLKEGFTLPEVLVSVTLLVILVSISVPIYLNQVKKAEDAVTADQVQNLARIISPAVIGDADTSTWSGLNTSTGSLAFDGASDPKNGILVYADSTQRAWCISKRAPRNGQVLAASSQNGGGVIKATHPCGNATSVLVEGTSTGTVVSSTGNELSDNVATGTDALGDTTGFAVNGGGLSSSTEQSVSGNRSLKFQVPTTSGYGVILDGTTTSGTRVVTPNTDYTLTYMVKTTGAATEQFTARIYWWNNAAAASTAYSESAAVVASNSTWKVVQVTAKSPGNANRVSLYLRRFSGTDGQTHYIDNVGFWKGGLGQWAPPGTPIFS